MDSFIQQSYKYTKVVQHSGYSRDTFNLVGGGCPAASVLETLLVPGILQTYVTQLLGFFHYRSPLDVTFIITIKVI